MLRDLLHGLRMARRTPGFAAAAVLLIALGVGANATIFTVAETLVFRPLPFRQPERLVSLWRQPVRGGTPMGGGWPHLADLAAQTHVFEGVAAYQYSDSYATGDTAHAEPGPVAEVLVSEGFLRLLGVQPLRGRGFLADEVLPELTNVTPAPVILSHEFWTRRLGAAPDTVGRSIRVGAVTCRIVGILPPDFRMLRTATPEVFLPLRPFPGHLAERRMSYLQLIGRVRAGAALEGVRRELAAYSAAAAKRYPPTDAGVLWKAARLDDRWFGSLRPVMAVLLGSVGCVLLIACANLAILLLVRATQRQKEIAMRLALGGGVLRVARQLMAESLVLAAAGGTAGLLAAIWATDLFTAVSVHAGLGLPPMRLDGAVVTFAVLITAATGILFGAAPAIPAWRADVNAILKRGGGGSGASPSRVLFQAIVVAEVGVATVLVIGAGLLFRSFARLNQVRPGFDAAQVWTLSIGPRPYTADFRRRDAAFWAELLDRTRAAPGVVAAAVAGTLPLGSPHSPENMRARITLEGRPLPPPGWLEAECLDVSPAYFRALGIPLRRGRLFADRVSDTHAVIINESFAREQWGSGDPVGKRIDVGGGRLYTIVGVAGDVRQYQLRNARAPRQMYRPVWPADAAMLTKWPSQYLVVRTSADLRAAASLLRGIVRSIDADRPVIVSRSMADVVFRNTAWDRVKTGVVWLFGAAALLLTLIGIHAVLAQNVVSRRREIAIRMALGGRPADIRCVVVRQAAVLVSAGGALGVVAALSLAGFAGQHLFEVSPADLPALAAAAAALALAALAACYLPARRATRVDPMATLRAE